MANPFFFLRQKARTTLFIYNPVEDISNDDLKVLLFFFGTVCVSVSSSFLQDENNKKGVVGLNGYNGGIIKTPEGQRGGTPDHAVVLYGYGYDEEEKRGFWVIRNSWGKEWGESGFFAVYMTKQPNDLFREISFLCDYKETGLDLNAFGKAASEAAKNKDNNPSFPMEKTDFWKTPKVLNLHLGPSTSSKPFPTFPTGLKFIDLGPKATVQTDGQKLLTEKLKSNIDTNKKQLQLSVQNFLKQNKIPAPFASRMCYSSKMNRFGLPFTGEVLDQREISEDCGNCWLMAGCCMMSANLSMLYYSQTRRIPYFVNISPFYMQYVFDKLEGDNIFIASDGGSCFGIDWPPNACQGGNPFLFDAVLNGSYQDICHLIPQAPIGIAPLTSVPKPEPQTASTALPQLGPSNFVPFKDPYDSLVSPLPFGVVEPKDIQIETDDSRRSTEKHNLRALILSSVAMGLAVVALLFFIFRMIYGK